MNTTTTHNARPELSFDGCGINGPDEYRTRICTFTDKRGPDANRYGPLFAAAPEMLIALEKIIGGMTDEEVSDELKEGGGFLSMSLGSGIVLEARAIIAQARAAIAAAKE